MGVRVAVVYWGEGGYESDDTLSSASAPALAITLTLALALAHLTLKVRVIK